MSASSIIRRTLFTSARSKPIHHHRNYSSLANTASTRIAFHASQPTISTTLTRPFSATTATAAAATMGGAGVHNIASKSEFDGVMSDADKQLVVLDCFATWCGPCKAIAPQVVKFADQYPNVHFTKVDVDEVPDVAQALGVRAMPTFILFKGGEKIDEVLGANPKALEAAIQKLTA